MLHGYGASNANMCLIAKNLAINHYDVYAMDMRGQGESGGERGQFDSAKDIYDDQWALIFEACRQDQIDQQKTPIYLYGRSFGGLIAAKMAATTIGRSMFRGVVFLTPFFKSYGNKVEKKSAIIKALCYIRPHMRFHSAPSNVRDETYSQKYAHFTANEARKVAFMTAQTGVMILEMFTTMSQEIQST